MSKLLNIVFLILLVAFIRSQIAGANPVENNGSALDFILLHNNDLHGHFEEISSDFTECKPEEALAQKCYGGFARISTLVKRYRNEQLKENGLSVLFLNGGDTYVGTPWFQIFKDKITSEFMNILKPDVGVRIHYSQFTIFSLFRQWISAFQR